MRRRRWLFVFVLHCSVLPSPATTTIAHAAQEPGIQWMHDLEAAKTLAKQTNRLVLVHFWTPSCAPCLALEQSVFNQTGVESAIAQRFVPVKLNANENSATAMGFGITRVPTDVILTPDGQVVGKLISPPTPAGYVAEINDIATAYLTKPGQAFANALQQAPVPTSLNAAYANLPVSSSALPAAQVGLAQAPASTTTAAAVASPFTPSSSFPPTTPPTNATTTTPAITPVGTATTPATPVTITNPMAATPPVTVNNPMAATPPTTNFAAPPTPAATSAQATPTPVQYNNRYAPMSPDGKAIAASPTQQPSAPIMATPSWSQSPQSAATPGQAPALVTGTSAAAIGFKPNATQPPSPQQPATAPATADTTPAASAAPNPAQLPPGAPPLGFDGYCPVSMRNHWKWIPGDPRWGIVHRGRTYWFASQTEQQQFWTDPDRYSPALSGMDPVMAVDHQQQVPGKREHSIDYDNLFYMFSSEATLAQFTANPERYAVSVRQAMGIPRGRLVR